jgi:hypothetical protein
LIPGPVRYVALDVFGGDFRMVRACSRHADLDTIRRYDDSRADHAGKVAAALSAVGQLKAARPASERPAIVAIGEPRKTEAVAGYWQLRPVAETSDGRLIFPACAELSP